MLNFEKCDIQETVCLKVGKKFIEVRQYHKLVSVRDENSGLLPPRSIFKYHLSF